MLGGTIDDASLPAAMEVDYARGTDQRHRTCAECPPRSLRPRPRRRLVLVRPERRPPHRRGVRPQAAPLRRGGHRGRDVRRILVAVLARVAAEELLRRGPMSLSASLTDGRLSDRSSTEPARPSPSTQSPPSSRASFWRGAISTSRSPPAPSRGGEGGVSRFHSLHSQLRFLFFSPHTPRAFRLHPGSPLLSLAVLRAAEPARHRRACKFSASASPRASATSACASRGSRSTSVHATWPSTSGRATPQPRMPGASARLSLVLGKRRAPTRQRRKRDPRHLPVRHKRRALH